MADFAPQTIPLGSLADAAAAGASLAEEEMSTSAIVGPGTTIGYMQP